MPKGAGARAEGAGPVADQRPFDERIRRVYAQLTAKQQSLAQMMINDEISVAFASVDDLAKRAGVDAATVVRFSQLLGYRGYAELRDSIRIRVPGMLTAVEKFDRAAPRSDDANGEQPSDHHLLEIIDDDIRNVQRTRALNDLSTIRKAIIAMDQARRLIVVADGVESFAADRLAHDLVRAGMDARRISLSTALSVSEIRSVTPRDVVVGIQLWRYIRHTVNLFEVAGEAGATTIAISDSKLSPLAVRAETSLVVETTSPELPHSVTALHTVFNLLVSGVMLVNRDRTAHYLEGMEDTFARLDVMQ